MKLENSLFTLIVILCAGVIAIFGMLWDLHYRKNVHDNQDAILSAIQYSLYYLFLIALLVVDWENINSYLIIVVAVVVGYAVIVYIRHRRKKNLFIKK